MIHFLKIEIISINFIISQVKNMCYLFLPKYWTIKPFVIGANYIPTSIYVCTYVVVK